MKQYTVFGNPVSHSKSPQMHNAGFKFLNLDCNYNKTKLEDGDKIKEIFLSNNIVGANITVPHKEKAFNNADEVIGVANDIGAVNTYINDNGRVIGYNTDSAGFMKSIEEFGDIKTAIILGAGGTAKAIAVAFKNKGIKTTVINRSLKRLDFFKDLGCITYTWDNFEISSYDLVVNSTSAGLKDENYPTPINMLELILKNSNNAIDCIYGKVTPFLKKAKECLIPYKDGEDMLLYQGIIAFELFTKFTADEDLINVMRKGLQNETE